jgi:hypothetical protein
MTPLTRFQIHSIKIEIMSSQKKKVTKAPEPKFRYNIGQKLFVLTFHKGMPENILEVVICARINRETKQYGIPVQKTTLTFLSYDCLTPQSGMVKYDESQLHPSFQQAANKFAEAFLVQRPL